jgi:hypothetical protein
LDHFEAFVGFSHSGMQTKTQNKKPVFFTCKKTQKMREREREGVAQTAFIRHDMTDVA